MSTYITADHSGYTTLYDYDYQADVDQSVMKEIAKLFREHDAECYDDRGDDLPVDKITVMNKEERISCEVYCGPEEGEEGMVKFRKKWNGRVEIDSWYHTSLDDRCTVMKELKTIVREGNCRDKHVSELKDMCRQKGASGYSRMKKDELVDWCCMDLQDTFEKMDIDDIENYMKERNMEIPRDMFGRKYYQMIRDALNYEKCDRMSVEGIKEKCREKRIRGYSGLTKADLIKKCCMNW